MIDFSKPARMIGPSKTRYHLEHPDSQVVFNANLCTKAGKFWWGDIDLTLEGDELQRLADQRREPVYVLRESDGRFANEANPLLNRALAVFTPTQC